MQTSKWGPSAWDYLHTLTFNYPENPSDDNKKYYYELFNNLKFTLPCKYCRESYSIFFKYININDYLDDRKGITYWLYTIHNIVNLKLNKKKVDFIDVVNYYEKRRANQKNETCKKKLCICNEMICCCTASLVKSDSSVSLQANSTKTCNCNQSNCDQCNKKQIPCNCDQCNNSKQCYNNKQCNCNQCNKNFDFVNKTKLKYDNITKNYIKKLIECTELKL
jgi:hypothetical protein